VEKFNRFLIFYTYLLRRGLITKDKVPEEYFEIMDRETPLLKSHNVSKEHFNDIIL